MFCLLLSLLATVVVIHVKQPFYLLAYINLELAKAVFKKKKKGQGFAGLVLSYVSIGPSALHEQQKRLDQRVTTYELPL